MTSLQTTQAYQVTYDYGKEGALVDALLGGDVPERRTPRKTNQAQVAALPDDDDDGSFGESDNDEAGEAIHQGFSPGTFVEGVKGGNVPLAQRKTRSASHFDAIPTFLKSKNDPAALKSTLLSPLTAKTAKAHSPHCLSPHTSIALTALVGV